MAQQEYKGTSLISLQRWWIEKVDREEVTSLIPLFLNDTSLNVNLNPNVLITYLNEKANGQHVCK